MINNEYKNISEHTNGQLPLNGYLQFLVVTTEKSIKLELVKGVIISIAKYSEDNWPDDLTWDKQLPQWFLRKIKSNTIEYIKKDERIWDYGSWLDAMKWRGWIWYSSNLTKDGFEIVLEPQILPYSVNPLEYVLYESGIDFENIIFTEHLH
jgi:hypothetical protein